MVQESRRQLRFGRRLIPSWECIMQQGTHEPLGVTDIEGHPRIMHDHKMLMVPVEV